MRDVLPDIERWQARGERVAIATVISMAGSAPRLPGAKLAVSESGELAGSVSGGCVEPAVFEAAMQVIKDSQPQLRLSSAPFLPGPVCASIMIGT